MKETPCPADKGEFAKEFYRMKNNIYELNLTAAVALSEAARSAVCKINIDSDLRLAMTGTIRKFFREHPDKFDPREYLKPARANIHELVKHKLVDVLGCAGHAHELSNG